MQKFKEHGGVAVINSPNPVTGHDHATVKAAATAEEGETSVTVNLSMTDVPK